MKTPLFTILSGIFYQTTTPNSTEKIEMLEGSVLIPSICVIMLVVIVAGIAITSQKNKH